jgi:hypothetical protein
MTTSIFTSAANILVTTKVRTAVRAAVAAGVGSLVTYFATKWGQFHVGYFAVAAPTISAAYYGAVSLAEIKFPKLGWLLLLLPQQKKAPVVPAPKPAPVNPTPAPVVPVTPAVKSKAVKKSGSTTVK